jgi:transposase
MTDDRAFSLDSLYVGGQPLLAPYLERLRVREFLSGALGPADPRAKLAPVDTAILLLRNIILSRHPLYGVAAWLRRFDPPQLGLEASQLRLVNDDRLGRTLDKLFLADRRTLVTRFVVHMVDEFGIELERLQNDSPSLTFSGSYEPEPERADGRKRLRIVHGHNKDHRPDLKQLVWSLTVSSDGAVPIHYSVYDGNVADDRTHIGIWEDLCRITGSSDFLYVADCKLCTRENMHRIDNADGRFLTVMPRTRKEDARFKKWIAQNEVPWKVIWDRPSLRRQDDPAERFEAIEAPEASAEGYRIVWYRSSEKRKRDERAREEAIHSARERLDDLRAKVGKRKLKTQEQVQTAVDSILGGTGTRVWVKVQLVRREQHHHKQIGPGRPGKDTRYRRTTTAVFEPTVTLDTECIRASAAADGTFSLITNFPEETKTPLDLLQIYKYQPFIEKRHEQLKTAAKVVPVNLKCPERIEAFLFLYFLAVVIHALIERDVRKAMEARSIKSIPLYPEERACQAPTADKILELFESLRVHRLSENGQPMKTFWDDLSDVQRQLLKLLEVSATAFGQ